MHLIEKQLQDFLITLAEEQSSFINLFGTKGDTLIPLSFLDQILSAEFLSKISKRLGYFDTHSMMSQIFKKSQKTRPKTPTASNVIP